MGEYLYLNQEDKFIISKLNSINVKSREFELIMNVYNQALEQVFEQLEIIKNSLLEMYGEEIINNIRKRIKSPISIINKMKKKNYEINYKNLIENIKDIAGIRIVCLIKDNIYFLAEIINKLPNINIVEIKDYIKKPKKSGYSGYHMIVETPMEIEGKKVPIKVEIQIRTMAMDFWASNEHKLKYKNKKKISFIDSKKLQIYAKFLNRLDNKINKLYKKQEVVLKEKYY